MSGEIKSGRLAGHSMWSAIRILAVPVFLQQLMQAGVGMADKKFAGDLPEAIRVAGLDAIGIGTYVGWFVGIAMSGLGIGGQAIIARAMGAGNVKDGEAALGQAVGLSMAWGAAVGAILIVISPPLAQACQLSESATAYFLQYMTIIAFGMPFAGLMMVGAMCLHGAGETTAPSVIAAVVNVVNVVASWVLSGVDLSYRDQVFTNPIGLDLHVRGIAAGTALSYFVGAALTFWVLKRGVKDLRLRRAAMVPRVRMTLRLVRIGMPNFLEGIAMWAVNLFILGFIGDIAVKSSNGEGLQGAHIIAVQWESFSFLPGFAIGTAAGALAGQYLGAGNPRMATRAILVCTGLCATLMGGLGIVFITCGEFLTTLISREPVHLETVPDLLRICGYVQIAFAVLMIMRQGLRGVGDTRWTFLITTVSSYGVRLPAAYYLGIHLDLGIQGIWYALCGEFIVRAVLFTARFAHGGWKRIKV